MQLKPNRNADKGTKFSVSLIFSSKVELHLIELRNVFLSS